MGNRNEIFTPQQRASAIEKFESLCLKRDGKRVDYNRAIDLVHAYRDSSLRILLSTKELTEEERENMVLSQLQEDAVIDPKNSRRARKQFEIIRNAYRAGRDFWDPRIEERARFEQDMLDGKVIFD